MSLAPGARLGTYELLSELGRGGMGVVWRARDTTLRREVALKVLPDQVARDPERLARFEREARVLASLNHPGIAHVYGFSSAAPEPGEPSRGAAAATTPAASAEAPHPFLVMELVPGETLADRIAHRPLALAEAIPIFLDIARALEAAHARGVVHRDLKPANIKLVASDEGSAGAGSRVKVLDFGLAKALAPETEPASGGMLSQSPTLTQAATMRGEILGTAAYMSPEQARGRPVDRRADVWAFGVCLHEALTGTPLFAGEDAAVTLAKVLQEEPRLDGLPPATPPAVRRLLRRCLAKRPEERLHDIADARLELEEALAEGPATGGVSATEARSDRRLRLAVAAGGVVLGLIAGLAGSRLLPGADRRPARDGDRFTIEAPGLNDLRALYSGSSVALSPDGSELVYVVSTDGTPQLWRRRFDRLEAEPIEGTEGGFSPAFSPDGKTLGFATARGLATVPAAGGLASPLERIEWLNFGWSWTGDGDVVFTDDRDSLARARVWSAPATGGEARRVTAVGSVPAEVGQLWPLALEGGGVVFSEWARDEESMKLVAVDAAGNRHPLLPGSHPSLSSTGHLVFTRPGSLWAVPFDAEALAIEGPAVRVVDDLATQFVTGRADYALGRDGTLVYQPRVGQGQSTRLLWLSLDGRREELPIEASSYDELSLSPDGTKVVLASDDLWVFDLNTGSLTRLPFEESVEYSPVWSPDGRTLLFQAIATGRPGLYRVRADGSSAPEAIIGGPALFGPKVWLEDSDRVIGHRGIPGPGGGLDIVTVSVDAPEGEPKDLIATPFDEALPALSPDGRWLAYQSHESGHPEIYVRPYPDVSAGKSQVSRGGGTQAAWSPSGDRLFYCRGDRIVAVGIGVEGDAIVVGQEQGSVYRPRYEMRAGVAFETSDYAVGPDGQRLLALVGETPSDRGAGPPRLVVIRDFARELERLAPRD